MNCPLWLRIISWALFSRLLLIGCCVVANIIIADHHAFGVELLSQVAAPAFNWDELDEPFNSFTKWDSVFYLRIAMNGYQSEKDFAFYPLYPYCVRVVAQLLQRLTLLPSGIQLYVVSGLLVSNLCFIASTAALALLLRELNLPALHIRSMIIIFFTNPASVFFTTVYTESMHSMLSWWSMLLYFRGRKVGAYTLIILSSCCRSNSSLNIFFFIAFIFQIEYEKYSKRERMICKTDIVAVSLEALLLLQLFVLPHVLWGCVIKHLLCYRDESSDMAYPAVFDSLCSKELLDAASPYSFIQDKYWNVGLFRYYQFRQIPNFLLALPIFIVSLMSVVDTFFSKENSVNATKPYATAAHKSLAIHLLVIAMVLALFAHIQISTRVIFSSSPLIYIQMNSMLHSKNANVRLAALIYQAAFCVLGLALHVNFFPWT